MHGQVESSQRGRRFQKWPFKKKRLDKVYCLEYTNPLLGLIPSTPPSQNPRQQHVSQTHTSTRKTVES